MAEDVYIIKLVRDRVGDTIGPPRGFSYKPVRNRVEHLKLLRQKLLEEVGEYLTDPTIEELADVQEVVDCIAALAHGGIAELSDAATRKRGERGSFADGTVMVAAALRVDGD
jgi:predicted house-cleaning noncanonical NTP pyrophosphatase (MazG superfamily)